MRTTFLILAAVSSLLLSPAAAFAQASGRARPCAASALEAAPASWTSFDPEARVETEPNHGLRYRYTVRPGGTSLVARGELDLTGCASLSFRVRASHAGGLAFGVNEPDESQYGTLTRVEAGLFTEVRLNLDELQLSEDSRDEDGRLGLGSGLSIWFLDLAVFSQTFDPAVRGERSLWLDAVGFSAERVPEAGVRPGPSGGALVLDGFETGLVRWIPVSATFEPAHFALYPEGAELSLGRGGADGPRGAVLEARYTERPMSAFVLTRGVAGLDLARAERFSFWLRADRPALFLASLEERSGARYEQGFAFAVDRWQRIELPIDHFRLAEDSRDANGRLDLASVKQVSIVAARLESGPSQPATLRLDEPAFLLAASGSR